MSSPNTKLRFISSLGNKSKDYRDGYNDAIRDVIEQYGKKCVSESLPMNYLPVIAVDMYGEEGIAWFIEDEDRWESFDESLNVDAISYWAYYPLGDDTPE